MISDSDRSEGRALLEARDVTRAPWFPDAWGLFARDPNDPAIAPEDRWRLYDADFGTEADAALIVWLRNHATELLDAVDELDGLVEPPDPAIWAGLTLTRWDASIRAEAVAAYKVELAEKVRALRFYDNAPSEREWFVEPTITTVLRLIEDDPAPSEGGESR